MSWSEVAAGVGGVASAVVPLGGGLAFVWHKIEKRFRRIEDALEECQARERQGHERKGVYLAVIEILLQEVRRRAPKLSAAAVTRAETLLATIKD